MPALLAAGADVEVAGPAGGTRVDMETWRPTSGTLIEGVRVPLWFTASAHERLTMRQSGDYPVAIVSIAADIAGDGAIRQIRVAVGALTQRAFRWTELEQALSGNRVDGDVAAECAHDLATTLPALDSVGVPGWYRRSVVPTLVKAGFVSLLQSDTGPLNVTED